MEKLKSYLEQVPEWIFVVLLGLLVWIYLENNHLFCDKASKQTGR